MKVYKECITCGTSEDVKGGWCEPCWKVAKKDVLEKYLCSKCGDAMPRKGDCQCEVSDE